VLGATADQDVVRRQVEAVDLAEGRGDRLAQRLDAADLGVLADLAAVEGDADRVPDVRRGVEVGLAGAEADDVDPLGLELAGLGGDGQGDGRLDDIEAGSGLDREAHCC
jgi:hypothetical protein